MNDSPYGFWAKLKKDDHGQVTQWHSLNAHSADVAAVTEALLQSSLLGRRLATLAGWDELSETHIYRLASLAAIHDAGKVNHGFQNKAYSNRYPTCGHVGTMLSVLNADNNYQEKILIPLGIRDIMSWFSDPNDETVLNFLCATWAHHGKPVPLQYDFRVSLWDEDQNRNPIKGLMELGEAIRYWFPKAFIIDNRIQPFPFNKKLIHAYNGLLTLADWIGSDERFFCHTEYDEFYITTARKNANRAVEELFLNPAKARIVLADLGVSFDLFCDFEPYEIQQKCIDLPLFNNGSLTILESDTGSGKTESAIARFLKLCEHGLVDGMYFAVPTRSAATQLYNRVCEAIKKVFPEKRSRPPVVQAVSGYIKVDGEEGTPLPDFRVLWPDSHKQSLMERGWAGEHPKRYLAGAVVIGTIDQVLMAGLRINHAHMRISALLRHFLVIDEVHASDEYMTRLLSKVLDMHLAAGGHALLMSATLGSAAKLNLTRKNQVAIPSTEEAFRLSYPLLTHMDGNRMQQLLVKGKSSGLQKRVEMSTHNIAGSPESVAKMAVSYALQGARVLIIRNLVKDCVETQIAIENIVGPDSTILFKVNNQAAPHHSRFAADDRKLLDRTIEHFFGRKSINRSLIVSATQTVEQSLDIDADFLITDLCPVDVMLQRIGRLHRHNRIRPEAFKTTRCVVLVPENRDLSAFIGKNGEANRGKNGLGTVYHDLRVLESTWRLLEDPDLTHWKIPLDNRLLVEKATHPEVLESILNESGGKWLAHQEFLDGRFFAESMQSGLVTIDYDLPFMECRFTDEPGTVKTRLGNSGYQVYLPFGPNGPFRNNITEITLPAWMIDEAPNNFEVIERDTNSFNGGFNFTFASRSFRYDRFGLSLIRNS